MGCDIHTYVERRLASGQWERVDGEAPFDWRSYTHFGFLADVRNYSATVPIADPRGFPKDASAAVAEEYEAWGPDAHTPSWLLVRELAEFDYDHVTNDRRVMRQVGLRSWDGGVTGEPHEGVVMTYREFLGDHFLRDVEQLKTLDDPDSVRVVFWFDN